MVAAGNGHVGVIIKILECIDDVEALIFKEDINGMTAFMHAVGMGKAEAALVIFDKVKDKTALLFKKNRPNLPAAIEEMTPEILQALVKKYNQPNY